MVTKVILLTTAGPGTWIVPADWGLPASIRCIGGGAANPTSNGGDYAEIDDPALTPGASIPYNVGIAGTVSSGSGGDTWFESPPIVRAKGGGSSNASIGTTINAGGLGWQAQGHGGGAGGGAGGPFGAGANAPSAGYGGAGDAGHGGAGGGYYIAGGNGTEWGTAGSGGGGGFGAYGGLYGGGGGSAKGAQGVIRIEYTPAAPGPISGAADLGFTASATASATGSLIGSAVLAIAASAVIAAAGALSGSANLSTTATGVLRATGALLGNADLVYTATGVASSGVGVHGTADLVFTTAATIQAAGELSGYSGLAFTASGTPSASGALAGPANLTFTTSGDLTAFGVLSGDADISFAAQAKPTQGYPPDPRYFVQLAPRPFYAAIESRPFLAQLSARTFYILSDPNMTPTFDTKDPRETVVLTFDASADLADGETLTAVNNVDVTMMRGSDPDASAIVSEEVINPSQITVGSATIAAGHGVQAIASAGLTGCWYLIAITCATSNSNKILTLKGILQVSSS